LLAGPDQIGADPRRGVIVAPGKSLKKDFFAAREAELAECFTALC
jgi:hypothetical protein